MKNVSEEPNLKFLSFSAFLHHSREPFLRHYYPLGSNVSILLKILKYFSTRRNDDAQVKK